MSKIYNIDFINDFIEGKITERATIEALENDYIFMIEVINYTNDKKMYNRCSDKVKGNHEFVKLIITKFKDDLQLICEVVDYFLELTSTKDFYEIYKIIEVLLTIRKFIKYEKNEYDYQLNLIYTTSRLEFELFKTQILNDKHKNNVNLGLGFLIFKESFSESGMTLRFFAEKMVKDIIEEFSNGLENILHENFNSFEELERYGINKFFVKFIAIKDEELADYVSKNISILDFLRMQLTDVKNNWSSFVQKETERKINSLICRADELVKENNPTFTAIELICYLANELDFIDVIKEYEKIDDKTYDTILANTKINKSTMTFKEQRCYYKLKRIMLEILSSKVGSEYQKSKPNIQEQACEPIIYQFKPKKEH